MENGGVLAWFGGTLVFAAEIGMLTAFGLWGFTTFDGAGEWAVGAGLPLAVAVFWGVFLSPKAARPLPALTTAVIRAGLFLVAAALLFVSGFPGWGFALGGIAAAGVVLSTLWPLEMD